MATGPLLEPRRGMPIGHVAVGVRVENFEHYARAARSESLLDKVPAVELKAVVDPNTKFLGLPYPLLGRLGLDTSRSTDSGFGLGIRICPIARLIVEGRECVTQIVALSDCCHAVLGRLPLLAMDFWIDVVNRRLVGNPEHGGEWMAEI